MMLLPAAMSETVSSEAIESSPSRISRTPSPRAEMAARTIVIAVVYSVIAILCLRTSPGSDPDIWWHMAAGRWILHHHAFPEVDAFSRLSPSPGWHAYSWLFDVLTYSLHHAFGLVGTMGLVVVMMLAIMGALHRMVAHLQADFLKVILLTLSGMLCLTQIYTPRSWLFSILFFVVQLDMVQRARTTGRWRNLLWLLPLYVLWANLHIQFIDGLVVLFITACEPLLMRWWPWPIRSHLFAGKMFAVLGGCMAATLINPYGVGLYHTAYKLASEPGVINQIQELLAMPFRSWGDYLVLGFAIAAAAMLGRQKMPDLWKWWLLVAGLVISFRSQRDVWFLVSIAVMILAEGLPSKLPPLKPLPKLSRFATASLVVIVIFVAGRILRVDNSNLVQKASLTLPVHAVDRAIAKGYSGPLFNDYTWGGYLIWRMSMPVSMDGRAALYGEKRIERSNKTWSGMPGWNADPALKSANLVIGPVNAALIQLLRQNSDFSLVYKDKVAAVFIRQSPAKHSSGK